MGPAGRLSLSYSTFREDIPNALVGQVPCGPLYSATVGQSYFSALSTIYFLCCHHLKKEKEKVSTSIISSSYLIYALSLESHKTFRYKDVYRLGNLYPYSSFMLESAPTVLTNWLVYSLMISAKQDSFIYSFICSLNIYSTLCSEDIT